MLYWPEAGAICRDGLAAKGCGRPAAVLPGKAGKGCLGRDALGCRALILPPNLCDLRADAACVLAAEKREEWVDSARLSPCYLRAPQAERERAARLRGEAGA